MRRTSPNLKFHIGNENILWNKVMKEVKLKRYAGPFRHPPFENFIQSPIGLVPKDGGKNARLIFHLSYPRDGSNTSVNANTPQELCKVKYQSIDDAVRLCINAGIGSAVRKSDMEATFRNVPLRINQFPWLLMKARSPIDQVFYYFVDKCLLFGSSISCAIFQAISDGLLHIVSVKAGQPNINYLDDFLFIALLKLWCDEQIRLFIKVCEEIGFPVSWEKTQWSDQVIIFLDLLINTLTQTISIPVEKLERAKDMIAKVVNCNEIMVKELQMLCGYLNFLCRAVVPGRAFTTRLYAPLRKNNNKNKTLKQHHHLKVTGEMKADLRIWMKFLDSPLAFSRPFIDFHSTLKADQM